MTDLDDSRRARRAALAAASSSTTARPSRLWGVVGLLGELLVTMGVFLLLFVAWQLWWTDIEAGRSARATVTSLREEFTKPLPAPDPAPSQTTVAGGVIEGRAFALLTIPRLGADWVQPVMEGTDLDTLSGGTGHYRDTALPGEVGNFAMAGHRTTWGRPFHEVESLVVGDRIVVETRDRWEVYAVTSHRIVDPGDVQEIAPSPDSPGAAPTVKLLTITTCHPKYSAAQRYIVHAQWVEGYTREQGLPASVLTPPSSAAAAGPQIGLTQPPAGITQQQASLTQPQGEL